MKYAMRCSKAKHCIGYWVLLVSVSGVLLVCGVLLCYDSSISTAGVVYFFLWSARRSRTARAQRAACGEKPHAGMSCQRAHGVVPRST
jgi:hypothetical protein